MNGFFRTPDDPYARLSLHDRLELLAFEARLAGFPESLIQATWEAMDSMLSDDLGAGEEDGGPW